MSVRIVQCLCPNRHCVMGFAYMPGVTIAPKKFRAGPDEMVLTEANAAGYLKTVVETMIRLKVTEGKCGICGMEVFLYEDARSIFQTIEEALPVMREQEALQKRARMRIDGIKRAGRN